ncbi:MAG: hypothetical protein JWO69_1475 [Thermoleophilia bacterium]|jgi:hypothetical protein|nr:hypothetical protein [Thermoleophilia bacterium]
MSDYRQESLPGSRRCVGCGGLTFRQRDDELCPRCAFEAESLIESIEIDGLNRDLSLITQFEAYYRQREAARARVRRLGGPVFPHEPRIDPVERPQVPFAADAFWTTLRDVG